jgi:cytochrome c-type biogenesis protein CcmH/NrfG
MKKDITDGYVKKETLVLVAIIALVVGFAGGVLLTIYKSSSDLPVQVSSSPQPAKEDQAVGQGNAVEMFRLERRTAEKPDDIEAWTQLGHLYFDSNNYDKAIVAYNKSLEINPDNADVWTDLGVMYRRSRRSNEAIKAFDRAIKIDLHHETSHFNKGIVLMHDLHDAEGAIKAWEELVSINPAAQTPSGQSVSELIKKFE